MASLPGAGKTTLTLKRKLLRINWFMVAVTAAIAAFGSVMLYSVAGGKLSPWAGVHMWRFAFGLGVLLLVALIDIRIWLKLAFPMYALALGLLCLVPLFGEKAMGAQRWLELGGFQVQPSELMKVALVLALAAYYNWLPEEKVSKPHYLALPLAMIAVPVLLVLKQPDLGTAGLLFAGGMAVVFLSGVHWLYFAAGVLGTGGAVPFLWSYLHDYQKARVLTFLDPERDPMGAGYHIIQSKIAVGSGGISGKGLMSGTQSQLNFLPEKHTDFIFTTLAEEFGLIGAGGLLALYMTIILLGIYIAIRCRNRFGRLIAGGLTFTFFLFVFINVAMVTGLVPVVGVPLPLVSYGGTAMLTLMVGIGFLLNAAVHRTVETGPQGGRGAASAWPVRDS
ncbi:MAG: rod shape-determining protein RodA [Hyphomicrobiales bacterium]